MVSGFTKFKERFQGFENQYVIIGGTACDLIMENEEFREYADKGGQVFISTHSPDFVNALQPDELFWLQKSNGATTIRKASEDATIKALYANGDKLGWLWREGYLKGSGPY